MAEQLAEFALVMLAISLASERFVVVAKTLVARLRSPSERQQLRPSTAPDHRQPEGSESEGGKGRMARNVAVKTAAWIYSRRVGEKERRIWVMLAAYVAAYVTTAFIADGVADQSTFVSNGLFGGVVTIGERAWPVWIVAFMASGGSAFWAQVVAYASALKDVRQARAGAELEGTSSPPEPPGERALEEMSWADIKRATNLAAGSRRS